MARATIPVIIDGDGKEWQGIAAVPAPYAKLKAGSLHLAWREDGIYGYARVKDASIDVDEVAPWKADTIELWIDQTGTRPPEMDDCVQLEISPNPQAGPGPCAVMVTQGQMDAHAIKSAWVQTADGYAIEFFIPAGQLAPAKMQPGTKIGFNYAIDLKGKAIEEFHADKDTREAYHTPSEWGVIALLP